MADRKQGGNEAIKENRQAVVDAIAQAMEQKGLAWAAGWDQTAWLSKNAVTGKPYRGINRLILALAMSQNGYEDPRWCTFNQLKKAGWHVEKGTKSSAAIEFWNSYVKIDGKLMAEDKAEQLVKQGKLPESILRDTFMVGKLYHVFNGEQIKGIEPLHEAERIHADEGLGHVADEFISSSRCPIWEIKSEGAYYSRSKDSITVPLREQFDSMEGFIRTLLHEMCHSTAPAVGREVDIKEWGDANYAREELVAEIGSAFAAADAGLDMNDYANAKMGQTFLENHAAYIKGWMEDIKDEPMVFAHAVQKAAKAADYVTKRHEEYLREHAQQLENEEQSIFVNVDAAAACQDMIVLDQAGKPAGLLAMYPAFIEDEHGHDSSCTNLDWHRWDEQRGFSDEADDVTFLMDESELAQADELTPEISQAARDDGLWYAAATGRTIEEALQNALKVLETSDPEGRLGIPEGCTVLTLGRTISKNLSEVTPEDLDSYAAEAADLADRSCEEPELDEEER